MSATWITKDLTILDLGQPPHEGSPAVPYPAKWIPTRGLLLVEALEALRAELGGLPLMITSAYRSPAFNEALRAAGHPVATSSQHCQGRAADIVVEGVTPTEVYAAARYLHRYGVIRLGGLGLYSRWVHLDLRPGPLKQWLRAAARSHAPRSRPADKA